MSLYQSIGTIDNLDESTPFFNNKAAVYGFVITLLVRANFIPLRTTRH